MSKSSLSDTDIKQKKRYYKITPFGDKNWCIVSEQEVGDSVKSWVEGMSVGYGLTVEVVEMTEAQFNKLPEYEP